jgi:AraC family transcriptional regulator
MSDAGTKKSEAGQIQPHFENGRAMRIVGLQRHYTSKTMDQIPTQWKEFAERLNKIPGGIGVSYGVGSNLTMTPFEFDYMSGVEVTQDATLDEGFASVSVPALHYAVFTHEGPVSRIRETIDAAWNKWMPSSGHRPVKAGPDVPYMMERYGEGFDPQSMSGDIELWIPIEN